MPETQASISEMAAKYANHRYNEGYLMGLFQGFTLGALTTALLFLAKNRS